jgi:uncharacterized protein (DUF1778 family)
MGRDTAAGPKGRGGGGRGVKGVRVKKRVGPAAVARKAAGGVGRVGVSPLMVRLDAESKSILAQAAALRRLNVSDYVRQVTVGQARREIEAVQSRTIVLSAEEQLQFWTALQESIEEVAKRETPARKRLGAMMRGES